MAVIGATELQPVNVVSNYLAGRESRQNQLAQQQEMAARQQELAMRQSAAQRENRLSEANELRAARLNSLVARKGTNLTADDLIGIGEFDAAKTLTGSKKESLDLVDKAMDASSRMLDTIDTPEQFMAWHNANHDDPVLGPWLSSRGITREKSAQDIAAAANDPAAFQDLLMRSRVGLEKTREQTFTSQNLGGSTRVIGMNKFGGRARVVPGSEATLTPKPSAVIAQEERVAAAGATPPTPGQERFSQVVGGKAAEQLDNLYTQAQSAESRLSLTERLKPLLDNSAFISGTLGDTRLAIAKALDMEGAEETQAYFAGIGGQVAEIIKAFGAGTGLSDSDRKFAEKMAGGSIELTPGAIRRIVNLNTEAAKLVISRYNSRRNDLIKKDSEVGDYYPEVNAPGSSGVVRVNSVEEARNLPPGTTFITPDGRTKVR
jgi:hypothetical protein